MVYPYRHTTNLSIGPKQLFKNQAHCPTTDIFSLLSENWFTGHSIKRFDTKSTKNLREMALSLDSFDPNNNFSEKHSDTFFYRIMAFFTSIFPINWINDQRKAQRQDLEKLQNQCIVIELEAILKQFKIEINEIARDTALDIYDVESLDIPHSQKQKVCDKIFAKNWQIFIEALKTAHKSYESAEQFYKNGHSRFDLLRHLEFLKKNGGFG